MMLRLREQITAHLHVVALVSKVYVDIMLTTYETERLLVIEIADNILWKSKTKADYSSLRAHMPTFIKIELLLNQILFCRQIAFNFAAPLLQLRLFLSDIASTRSKHPHLPFLV